MTKKEALLVLGDFIDTGSSVRKKNGIEDTVLTKSLDFAYSALKSEVDYIFSDAEIELLCNAVISSVVPTSRGLQDKLYNLLMTHEQK